MKLTWLHWLVIAAIVVLVGQQGGLFAVLTTPAGICANTMVGVTNYPVTYDAQPLCGQTNGKVSSEIWFQEPGVGGASTRWSGLTFDCPEQSGYQPMIARSFTKPGQWTVRQILAVGTSVDAAVTGGTAMVKNYQFNVVECTGPAVFTNVSSSIGTVENAVYLASQGVAGPVPSAPGYTPLVVQTSQVMFSDAFVDPANPTADAYSYSPATTAAAAEAYASNNTAVVSTKECSYLLDEVKIAYPAGDAGNCPRGVFFSSTTKDFGIERDYIVYALIAIIVIFGGVFAGRRFK